MLQRVIHGLFGAFLGAVIAFGAAWYFEQYVLVFVLVGSVVCFFAAFVLGDRVFEWLARIGWWV